MGKTILIVEDDTFLQRLETTKLKKDGYNILTAVNSIEAFKAIAGPEKIDLVLLDLLLPDVDGFTILEQIRQNDTTKITPVIVFSNLSEEKDVSRATKLGASKFMVKSNFTLDEISKKIKELIG